MGFVLTAEHGLRGIHEGTSIVVYGTANPGSQTIEFVVDGAHRGSFDAPASLPEGSLGGAVYHQRLYTSPTLAAGQHTLVVTSGAGDGVHVFLDYFVFTPSPAATSTGLVYIVDDTSTQIQYDDWSSTPTVQDTMLTAHTSTKQGAKVTFSFEGAFEFVFL